MAENVPPQKKRRLSLSLKKDVKAPRSNQSCYDKGNTRFAIVDDNDVEVAAKGVVPANTAKNNAWAARNFSDWVDSRNKSFNPDDRVPDDLLSYSDPAVVCSWLCRFVLETRQKSGEPYPPKSIYSILCGLYRISRANGVPFNFLDKTDTRFGPLNNTLDSLFSKLHADGVGAVKKSAQVITVEDEKLLLEQKIMSYEDPKSLQRLVFFYAGLHLCLRGVQEHHDLRVDQLERHSPDTGVYNENTFYKYTEFISKNNQHRFKDIHGNTKVVKVHAILGSENCFVKILDFYFSKLPPEPKAFYLRPHVKIPIDKPWYINVPVGINTLKSILPKMSEEAGTSIRYTNHSLRATSTTRLFASNIPEKVIQEKSGHRSLAGLRAYEKTTTSQERSVTKILTSIENFPEAEEINCQVAVQKPLKEDKKGLPPTNMFTGELHNCVFNFHL